MEVLNQRKMSSRLYLIHPRLQGKVRKKQTHMKETRDRKGHERKLIPGESVYVKNFGSGLKCFVDGQPNNGLGHTGNMDVVYPVIPKLIVMIN